ncbi:MAG: hypothetical protein DYG98_23975 [Haliscomenobacteraceae bacterium CHB4]|nr:hypothetical protein [Haliscomenobacteraceae bacterium CHB4]
MGNALCNFQAGNLQLTMITNRGVKVWPNGNPATFCTDHWRCRFKSPDFQPSEYQQVFDLLFKINLAGLHHQNRKPVHVR